MRNCSHTRESKMADRFLGLLESDLNMKKTLGDQIIKQLLNLVIAKSRDLSRGFSQINDLRQPIR